MKPKRRGNKWRNNNNNNKILIIILVELYILYSEK